MDSCRAAQSCMQLAMWHPRGLPACSATVAPWPSSQCRDAFLSSAAGRQRRSLLPLRSHPAVAAAAARSRMSSKRSFSRLAAVIGSSARALIPHQRLAASGSARLGGVAHHSIAGVDNPASPAASQVSRPSVRSPRVKRPPEMAPTVPPIKRQPIGTPANTAVSPRQRKPPTHSPRGAPRLRLAGMLLLLRLLVLHVAAVLPARLRR